MGRRMALVMAMLMLLLAAMACSGISQSAPTPTLTMQPIVVPPTLTPEALAPTATLASPPSAAAVPLPTVLFTATVSSPGAVVVASHESKGQFAIAMLTGVRLTPGHSYRLMVSSPAGQASFHGEWSTSALGRDGMPGVKTGLLDGTTPATYEIMSPVQTVARDWLYSASAQNRGAGGIKLTIVDITGK